MGLPWVRLDTNIHNHDKMIDLLADPSPKRYQAATSYMFSLAWAGGAGNNGRVKHAALPVIHGNAATARLLVKYGFWDEAPGGYQIRNYGTRQQLSERVEKKLAAQQAGGVKGNCIRYHGPDCGCWKTSVEGVA